MKRFLLFGITTTLLFPTPSQSNTNRAVGCENIFSDTANNFYITGVQLEPGDQCTEFEHEPIGETLSKCERYYEIISVKAGTSSLAGVVTTGQNINERKVIGPYIYKTEKRATPSIANVTIGIDGGDTTHSFAFSTDTRTTSGVSTTSTDIGEADSLENDHDIIIDAEV